MIMTIIFDMPVFHAMCDSTLEIKQAEIQLETKKSANDEVINHDIIDDIKNEITTNSMLDKYIAKEIEKSEIGTRKGLKSFLKTI